MLEYCIVNDLYDVLKTIAERATADSSKINVNSVNNSGQVIFQYLSHFIINEDFNFFEEFFPCSCQNK